jgi:hypothetical protein
VDVKNFHIRGMTKMQKERKILSQGIHIPLLLAQDLLTLKKI